MQEFTFPIIDLHCDLLLYLAIIPDAQIDATQDIGVTLPYLKAGNVRQQTVAVFGKTDRHSVDWGAKQLAQYEQLLQREEFYAYTALSDQQEQGIGLTLAIENASILALEEEPVEKVFSRLERYLAVGKRLFYITLTHHTENRFGGGNYSTVGLKPDGERLLEYMAGHNIPVDLSHTSDALAEDILNYIVQHNLQLPVLASHSNFRSLRDHPRNLTNEIVQEIVHRKGLIGANFLRLFLNGERSESLLEHIEFGLAHAPDTMAFGADFFYRPAISAPERQPLFFTEYEDAGQYPKILRQLRERGTEEAALHRLASENVRRFTQRVW
ncbi:MAG: membrane dipeptidase [Bacteroidota bacterium]